MSVRISSLEHALAAAVHDIVVGAKAVRTAILKAGAVVQKDAPAIAAAVQKVAPEVENLTALVDPRAAVIERIGAALIGQALPQITSVAAEVTSDAQAPSVPLTVELFNDLKALAASLATEISGAKSSLGAV